MNDRTQEETKKILPITDRSQFEFCQKLYS